MAHHVLRRLLKKKKPISDGAFYFSGSTSISGAASAVFSAGTFGFSSNSNIYVSGIVISLGVETQNEAVGSIVSAVGVIRGVSINAEGQSNLTASTSLSYRAAAYFAASSEISAVAGFIVDAETQLAAISSASFTAVKPQNVDASLSLAAVGSAIAPEALVINSNPGDYRISVGTLVIEPIPIDGVDFNMSETNTNIDVATDFNSFIKINGIEINGTANSGGISK